MSNVLDTKHKGSESLVERIKLTNKDYMHELYMYATKTNWILAGFAAIVIYMNMKSVIPNEQRPTLTLHQLQINRWFKRSNGKEYSPKEKPLDTTEHPKLRP